ncbi:MAG: hypothetical protein MHMPM18_002567 [Marteilia pararefringens]
MPDDSTLEKAFENLYTISRSRDENLSEGQIPISSITDLLSDLKAEYYSNYDEKSFQKLLFGDDFDTALIDLERFKQIFKDLSRSLFDNDELKSAAKLIFSQFDSDKSGFLTCPELKRLLESENLYFKPEFDKLVEEFSGNEEKLTFDYFWEMIVQFLRR